MLAWHFLPEDRRLANGGSRLVEQGSTLKVEPPIICCSHGLHASERAIDALEHAPGPWICRVECGGEIVHHENGDKIACSERTVLWMADASIVLHEFACKDAAWGAAWDAARWDAARDAQNRVLSDMLSSLEGR